METEIVCYGVALILAISVVYLISYLGDDDKRSNTKKVEVEVKIKEESESDSSEEEEQEEQEEQEELPHESFTVETPSPNSDLLSKFEFIQGLPYERSSNFGRYIRPHA